MSSVLPQSSIDTHNEIDTCGLRCPLPLLRAKQALKSMQVGECLKVLATDPAAKPDFDAMLKHLPHSLLDYQRFSDLDGAYPQIDVFIIQKGEAQTDTNKKEQS